tara:strand:- start:6125 stop:7051 length:927 start_codon:yes stop_codon:yes gene_type:complete
MPTIYELLGQLGGQQKIGFDLSKLNIKKIFEGDKRALQKYEIALQEEAADREKDIKNQRSRGAGFRAFGKLIDFVTGTPGGTIGSNLLQGVTKNRRFTLSSPFGEKVDDPYRDLDVDRPDTTFLSTAGKRLDSKANTISDFISNAETQFDEAMVPNLITDLITSGQTKAAGFTPDYLKDIFKNVKEGENFFDAFKTAEEARRAGLMDKAKTSLSGKVGASSVDSPAFSKQMLKDKPYENIRSLFDKTAGAGYSKFKRGQSLIDMGVDPRMFSDSRGLFKAFDIDNLEENNISNKTDYRNILSSFMGGN